MANYERFRELLKTGIGTRSQKDFANATGIARETISRLLNKEEIPQPSMDTLKRIARHITNCSLNDLYESCGYKRISLEADVQEKENELMAGVDEHYHYPWGSVEEFVGNINTFWISDGKLRVSGKETEVNDSNNPADYSREIELLWSHEGLSCQCRVNMFYVKSKKDNVIFTSYEMCDEELTTDWAKSDEVILADEERHILHTKVIKFKENAYENADNLIDLIMGSSNKYVKETITGLGFEYKCNTENDIKKFQEFLVTHAAAFCTCEKNREIYEHVNEMPDVKSADDYLYDNDLSFGDIVALIMKEETGLDYKLYSEEWSIDQKPDIIMFQCDKKVQTKPGAETLFNLHRYAKELNIPEFGACYFEVKEKRISKYKTSEFYLKFN